MSRNLIILFCFAISLPAVGQEDALSIIRKSEEKLRGVESSMGESKMIIVRPTWTREITIKSWSKGDDYSLMLITAPSRDKGTTFLKREKEIWTWQPSIERSIKLPPSMMMQSWMGSDFTNDDLVRESSIIDDYTHRLLEKEEIDGRNCYQMELTPKPEAPVVWGKVIIWIDDEEYMQLKVEFYDEESFLVNTMYGKDVREIGGRLLPGTLEMVPADEEGKKTIVETVFLQFDVPMEKRFFSLQNMQNVQ